MKFFQYTRQIAALAITASVLVACDKVDSPDPLDGDGQTIVKLIGGGNPGHALTGVDYVNTTQTLVAADIRRDVPNNAELNRTMTVTIKDDTAALRAYNVANGTNILQMPASWYSLSTTAAGGVGGTYTVVLDPGEFSEQIRVTIPDATVLDPSSTYGFAFTITTVDADGVISAAKTIVYELGAKNDYDGIYEMTGTYVDFTNAAFTGAYPNDLYLVTTGATSVDVKQLINGAIVPGYLFLNAGAGSFFGNYGISMSVDPVTNKVDKFFNYYGDPTRPATAIGNPGQGSGAPLYIAGPPSLRRAALDPSGVNAYDPATKTFTMKYWLIQGNITPGNPRGIMTETWRYIGPR